MQDFQQKSENFVNFSGWGYLKENPKEFQPHFFTLEGNELYIFKNPSDKEPKYMFCLVGCYLIENEDDD